MASYLSSNQSCMFLVWQTLPWQHCHSYFQCKVEKETVLFFSPAFHQVLIVPRLKADWFHAHFGCWLHPLDIVFCFLRRLFSTYQAVGCFLWQGVGRCIVTDSRAWALPCQLKDIRPIKWHEFHLRRLARSQPFFGNMSLVILG